MRWFRTPGSMSRDGNGVMATGPKPPRLSLTLPGPNQRSNHDSYGEVQRKREIRSIGWAMTVAAK
jgi:hypothetical protein